jgi:putative serine protease PepD
VGGPGEPRVGAARRLAGLAGLNLEAARPGGPPAQDPSAGPGRPGGPPGTAVERQPPEGPVLGDIEARDGGRVRGDVEAGPAARGAGRPLPSRPAGAAHAYVDTPVARPPERPAARPGAAPDHYLQAPAIRPTARPAARPQGAPDGGRPRPVQRALDAPAARAGRAAAAPVAGRRRRAGLVALVLAVALVSAAVGGVAGVVASRNQDLLGGTAATGAGGARGAAVGAPEGDQLQRVLGAVLPAVVKVEARTDSGKATGSGVVFAKDGYVLTNAHVVDRAQSIGVTLSTSEPLRARFVGRDLNTDLAVLKVRRAGLTVATVGRSADLRVGDAAIVVGSPFGFQSSVTTGIVSALHRVVKVPDDQGTGEGRELVDAIQTDAAINPGNSGGALANASGEVVGISTAIATDRGGEANAGVGFAIPIDEAVEVAKALVDRKPVQVPFLGADLDGDVSPEDVQRFKLGGHAGALVGVVRPRSPAAEGGLRRGDLVVRFGDQPVAAADQLTVALRRSEIGLPVPVTVLRRGRQLVLQVTPTDQPGR